MENVLDKDADSAVENRLTEEVNMLWTEHIRAAGAKRATTSELRQLRARLAERLFEMKALLCRPGRGGEWRGWLSTVGIPRSTGDRLVERHAEILGVGTGNVLTEAATPEEEVAKLIKALVPRLRRVLTSPQLAHQYVVGLIGEFGLEHETTESGILLRQPAFEQTPTPETQPHVNEEKAMQAVGHSKFPGIRIAQPYRAL